MIDLVAKSKPLGEKVYRFTCEACWKVIWADNRGTILDIAQRHQRSGECTHEQRGTIPVALQKHDAPQVNLQGAALRRRQRG